MRHLKPAVRKNSRIYYGNVDDSHDTVRERFDLSDGPDSENGFIPSDRPKMFLNRIQAISWLKQFEPMIFSKVKGKLPPEGLHSTIYAAAKGVVQKLTKEAKEEGFIDDSEQGEAKEETEAIKVSLKDKTICIIDHGISIHLAEKLAESYGEVLLYIPNIEAYPCPDRDVIGTGLEGVTRIYDIHDAMEKGKVDIFFFPDIGFSGMQRHLKEMGFHVCGSGDSDILELDKWFFQEQLEKAGLPTAKTEKIKGIAALKEYLKKKKEGDCFIKISFHRGLMETKRWLGEFLSSVWLKDLEVRLGHHAESQVFLVQDKIDSIGEIGMDTFNLDGELPENSLCGLEIKDAGYLCRVFKEQPEILQEVNDKMATVFKKLGMNGQYSTEVRITEKLEGYYIDGTMRMPSPPGELMPEMYKKHNYAQAIWDLAHNKLPVLEPAFLYGAEIIITSSWLEDNHWLPVEFPEECKKYIRLKNYHIMNGKYYIIPNGNGAFLGAAIGMGNTPEEACKMALKYADMVHGEDVKYEPDVLERAQKGIAKMKAAGISF